MRLAAAAELSRGGITAATAACDQNSGLADALAKPEYCRRLIFNGMAPS